MKNPGEQLFGGYTIRIKSVTPQRLVVGRLSVAQADWGLAGERLLADVWKFLNSFENITVGPAMARLTPNDSGDVLVEAGFPVGVAPDDVEPFSIAELPACQAATLLLIGPYERLPEATAALDDWLKTCGRKSSEAMSAPWLVFWATPDDVGLPAELRTELVWPLGPQS